MVNETASLNLKYGPPLRPLNFRPIKVKATNRPSPFFPLGKSAGAFTTLSICESGNKQTYNLAASSPWPPTHRRGLIRAIPLAVGRCVLDPAVFCILASLAVDGL